VLRQCSGTSSGALDEGGEGGTWARVTVGAPCAKVYLVLELARGRELFGWLVHTGCATEDVVRRYITHLTPNSEHATWTAA
jgi:hypothetical protein